MTATGQTVEDRRGEYTQHHERLYKSKIHSDP